MNEQIKPGTMALVGRQVSEAANSDAGRICGRNSGGIPECAGVDKNSPGNVPHEQLGRLEKSGARGDLGRDCGGGTISSPTWCDHTAVFIKRGAAVAMTPIGTDWYPCEVYNRWSRGFLWLALVSLVVMLCTGCKSTTASYDPTKGTWKITDRRFGIRTEAEVTASVETNGTKTVTIKAKSDPSVEAIKAVAEGVATGVMKGAKHGL